MEEPLKVSYHREMKKNYLMIEGEAFGNQRFETKMLIGNTIDGLLKFRIRKTDGISQFCYEITSKQPLKRLLETRSIGAEQIKKLLLGIVRTLTGMEEYLLSEEQMILDPEFIYVDPEDFSPGLCLIPGRKGDFPKEFSNLLQELLDKVDHQDKEAVIMIYGLYRESLKENYGMDNLLNWLVKTECPNMDNVKKEEESEIIEENIPRSEILKAPERKVMKQELHFPLKEIIVCGMMMPCICGGLWLLKGPRIVYSLLTQRIWLVACGCIFSIAGMIFFIGRWRKAKEPMGMIPLYGRDGDEKPKIPGRYSPGRILPEGEQHDLCYEKNDHSGKMQNSPWKMVFSEEEKEEVIETEEDKEDSHTILLWSKEPEAARRLVCEDGKSEPITIAYFPFLIGKQTNLADYTLSRETVSRIHVRIDQTESGYCLTDLNSTNGTSVNGKRLENNETVNLSVGDQVGIADINFSFQ